MSNTKNVDNQLFAVFRNGHRVSEAEYPSKSFAEKEFEHWKNIIAKYPDGSKLEILPVRQ